MVTSAMWMDPDDKVAGGVLLSDRISFYVDAVGLIKPFDKSLLGPASYSLTLGTTCLDGESVKKSGKTKRILGDHQDLELPPNSITFVSSAEILRLPFYIAGRFNLRLKLLHEGLLVGAGPQIDPGFRGQLSCPLHNISSEKICLQQGRPFAVVEFYKTTPFAEREKFGPEVTEEGIRRRGEGGSLRGLKSHTCYTFPSRSLDRDPITRYVPSGKVVDSSIAGIAAEVASAIHNIEAQVAESRTHWRNVQVIALASLIGAALTLGTYFWASINWTTGWVKSLYESQAKIEERVRTIEEKARKLETLETKPQPPPPSQQPQQKRATQ